MAGKKKKEEWRRHWVSGGWEINPGFHFMYYVSLREEELKGILIRHIHIKQRGISQYKQVKEKIQDLKI